MNSLQLDIWKNSKTLFFTMALGLGFSAQAQSFFKEKLGGTGSLRPSYWQKDKSYSDKRDYLAGSAWITLRPEEWNGFKSYLEAYVAGQDFSRDSYSEGELREAYVEKTFGNLDIKMGRQIVIWGRGDKVNPTDNLTVRNFRLLMTDDEDQRLGIFSTQMVYNTDNWRFIGV